LNEIALNVVSPSGLPQLGSLEQVSGTLFINLVGPLSGLESLQQVRNLELAGLSTNTLEPLGNLTTIGTARSGMLRINAKLEL